MELPKNITQIGESNQRCKIYVEDYVISYMKQMNQLALNKDMAVALYGVRKEENDVSYLFLYGACKLTFLQRETRHLSQAQQQEIEKYRQKYFSEYSFLGYRLLNGEMIEGFHVCEQGICRYISGYAQFYEKNDSMLAYMLDVREEAQPEVVDEQKYEAVKRRQEERRLQHEENAYYKVTPSRSSGGLRGMRVAVFGVFALLCVIGLTAMNRDGQFADLQAMARQVMSKVTEQRIPDAEDETGVTVQADSLVAEDKLADAVLQENEAATSMVQVSAPGITDVSNEMEVSTDENEEMLPSEAVKETEERETPEQEAPVEEVIEQEVETLEEPQPVSYTIKAGDTLIGISVRNYGSDMKVSDICALNQIENPDDIKVGQKILLP